jgi:hypothetical protein
MERLSLYCRGHTIRILDAVEGVVEADLGSILSEYNQLNTEPSYSSGKLIGKDLQLVHHVAGFLGVYGNLASCTFLHGAIMSQIVDSFSQLGVAGDDGLIDSSDDYTTFFVIRLLGLAEESKGYTTEDPGWQIYLKRPIRQSLNRVFAESFALYSMIEHLFEEDDKRFFTAPRSHMERKASLASSIVVYLRSLSRLTLSVMEKESVHAFLLGIYRHAGFPVSGYLPNISSHRSVNDQKLPSTLVPSMGLEHIGKDPIESTITSLYDGVAVLPEKVEIPIEVDQDLLYVGSEFVATGSAWLSYLRKLGFVELEQSHVVYSGEEGLGRLLRHYSLSRDLAKYTVSVLRDVPVHLLP